MDRLQETYYDPQRGFQSAPKLYAKLREQGIRYQEVVSFLNSQRSYQLNKIPRRPRQYRSIVAPFPTFGYQIDIMVYDRHEFHHYKYILTCIDVHSRYVAARVLTTRQAPTIVDSLKSIFSELGVPLNVNCDQEFVQSALIKDWLLDQGITIYASDPDEPHKNALVERFHRTLALMLQRWRHSAGGLRDWPKVLPKLIENYNHTIHSTTKQRPIDVFKMKAKSLQIPTRITPKDFQVGAQVRVVKGDVLRYSRDVYGVEFVEGNRYKLVNLSNGARPSRRYKEYELIAAGQETGPALPEIQQRPNRSMRRVQAELHSSLATAAPNSKRARKSNPRYMLS